MLTSCPVTFREAEAHRLTRLTTTGGLQLRFQSGYLQLAPKHRHQGVNLEVIRAPKRPSHVINLLTIFLARDNPFSHLTL